MRSPFLALAILTLATGSALAQPAPAPAASAPADAAHFNTEDSTIGELLDNAGARAVLQNHVPAMISNPQIDMARGMTLKSIQAYSPELTDEKLVAIDADLARLPAH